MMLTDTSHGHPPLAVLSYLRLSRSPSPQPVLKSQAHPTLHFTPARSFSDAQLMA